MTANKDAAADRALIPALQQRLKVPRGALPKPELIAVALQLAQQPALDPNASGFWKAQDVRGDGGTRKRILAYRDRMLGEGHLAAAQQAISQPAAPPPSVLAYGLEEHLMVQHAWMNEHVPHLSDIVAQPLVLSPGRRHATRSLSARHEQSGEEALAVMHRHRHGD
jgi:hypothetical protein